jgi:hypothetical protein
MAQAAYSDDEADGPVAVLAGADGDYSDAGPGYDSEEEMPVAKKGGKRQKVREQDAGLEDEEALALRLLQGA